MPFYKYHWFILYIQRASILPSWEFETVKAAVAEPVPVVEREPVVSEAEANESTSFVSPVKAKAVQSIEENLPPKKSRTPPTSFVKKLSKEEKSDSKKEAESAENRKTSALYEAIAPILDELKDKPEYVGRCVS